LQAIGHGTWYMVEDARQSKTEVAELRAGMELGLTLIDTSEMYADGCDEKVVGEALIGLRENVFLVSKVYPWNAGGQKAINACEASLRRLNTDYRDLYLL
ncbi:aldo/keto reductase, partial [Escherichia coli]|uniref:aldo/keto reductase n=1 Tax=Escherichia coli TaxID=562 RepID=UPI0011156DA7